MNTMLARSKPIIFAGLLLMIALASAQPRMHHPSDATFSDTRCGWFSNPTPSNASLHDKEAEWIIGVQGGHQAEGDWPEFGPRQWVRTNNNYGYGCACMRVQANRRTHEVSRIESAQARSLSACRKDAALKRWGFK